MDLTALRDRVRAAEGADRPKRIQRRRTKGFRLGDAVYVGRGRGSVLGNPFTVADAIESGFAHDEASAKRLCADAFRDWLGEAGLHGGRDWWQGPESDARKAAIRAALPGLHNRDLACWCKLCPMHRDKGKPLTEHCPHCDPCHIDILAELLYGANSEARRG